MVPEVLHPYSVSLALLLKVAQLCLILCDPMDYTVHGILQARILSGLIGNIKIHENR